MNRKSIGFLKRSLTILIVTCVVVFVVFTILVARKTDQVVKGVSDTYISEINKQVQQKFETLAHLRIDQVSGIVRRTPENSDMTWTKLKENLQTSTEVRGFEWLGLGMEDGSVMTVYGDEVKIQDGMLVDNLVNNGHIIMKGIRADGRGMFVFGTEAGYLVEDGKKSICILAAVSMESLEEALFRNQEHANAYSYLIDQNGEYVIRSGGEFLSNYFEHLQSEIGGEEGEQCVRELQESIRTNKDYIITVSTKEGVRHMYCSSLPHNSRWFLVTVMPDEVFGSMISNLDTTRNLFMICAIVVILIVILIIFRKYYANTKGQIRMLETAKRDAEQANMAKSNFLASMSHDIRTPMNAIVGMTEIAMKNKMDLTRLDDCLVKIKLSSKQLLGLINDVLDMSKIESGKMTLALAPLSLRDTMNDIVNIIKPQIKDNNQYFDILIGTILAEDVYCDGVRLNQVLLNLLSNALKFTKEQGAIHVSIYQEASELGEEYVRTHFEVEDTGIGMSKEFQKTIFERFAREDTTVVRNISGMGLGMAITKNIIDLMDGTIEIDSTPGKGSKFHIILDLKKSQISERDMKLPPWNILVVDDDERLCRSTASNLEELGTHVEWTMDSKEAIRMMEERHVRGEDYQFVLMDWKMPTINGIDVIREIRKRIDTKKIPFFLISAYDWSDIESMISEEDEIAGFIGKPLFMSTLYTHLSHYAESGRDSEPAKEEKNIESLAGKKILLSEDIDLNWEVANAILSEMGLEVDRAVNGQECVEMFEAAEPGHYDAILMDIRMPVMNGYDATMAIRKLERPDAGLPIIALTADAFSDDAQHCFECGMNDHITKPIDVKECMRILNQHLC